MAAIIFDRTIKADEKWAKLQKLSGAEDDTPETNEKEKAFLIKLDKFFEFYDKEILAKATPKVKAMLGQLEEMFKHPSQMDKMSDDAITNKIQQMAGDMDTTDQLNLMSSIIKIHERLEKDGILKELEDLADEST